MELVEDDRSDRPACTITGMPLRHCDVAGWLVFFFFFITDVIVLFRVSGHHVFYESLALAAPSRCFGALQLRGPRRVRTLVRDSGSFALRIHIKK